MSPKWDIPTLGGSVVSPHVPIPSPSFPWSCQLCSQWIIHQPEGSRGVFSLVGHILDLGEVITEAASWHGGSQDQEQAILKGFPWIDGCELIKKLYYIYVYIYMNYYYYYYCY